MVLDILNSPLRLTVANFLNIQIVQNSFIWINIWSIIHLIFGIAIIYLLIKTFKIKKFVLLWLFLILLIFEIIEFFSYTYWFVDYFIPENIVDIVWDIIVGMFGGLIAWLKWRKK